MQYPDSLVHKLQHTNFQIRITKFGCKIPNEVYLLKV